MSSCQGKQNTHTCYGSVYKCNKCGSVGCQRPGCTNHLFNGSKCLKCGHTGKSSV